jgi:hypothetical protein
MAETNGTDTRPTIAELIRIHEEGIPQTLLSGVEVRMRPARLDVLLESGDIPDILTPMLIKGLYESIAEDVNDFAMEPQQNKKEIIERIRAMDAVGRSVLIEPDQIQYLSLGDRMWLFKLAFMPAEVLSRFRLQSAALVDDAQQGYEVSEVAERTA